MQLQEFLNKLNAGEHGIYRVRSASIYAQSSTGSTEINRSIKQQLSYPR